MAGWPERDRGTPQGSAVSPVLANLFMHYAFDSWLEREFPAVEFERFADDAVVHCATERQATQVLAALGQRMTEVGLALHPEKTKIVYCKDRKRRLDHEHTSFTFLGYTFRARKAPTRDGRSMFAAFLPAVSRDALKKMSGEVRRWRINLRTTSDLGGTCRVDEPGHPWLDDLLRQVLPDRAGWPPAAHQHLPGALGAAEVQAAQVIQEGQTVVERAAARQPALFAHWAWMTEF